MEHYIIQTRILNEAVGSLLQDESAIVAKVLRTNGAVGVRAWCDGQIKEVFPPTEEIMKCMRSQHVGTARVREA